jgi:multicomponent Na+:H+ antiporter subunit D
MTMTDAIIWVVALPLAGALAALLLPRLATAVAVGTALATSASAAALLHAVATQGALHYELGGWSAGLGIALRADGLSALLLMMTALVVLAASIYASAYFKAPAERSRFWPLWLLLWTALNALLLSGDLFNLYVTLELLGLSAVALAALGGKRAAVAAALRYLLVGLLGSMMFLAGVSLIYAGYGTLDMAQLAHMATAGPTAWTALTLMTTGLLLKTALFPLHFWLPPAHASAPAPVSAVLSALVVKAAFYLVLRLWLDVFAGVVTPAAANLLGALASTAGRTAQVTGGLLHGCAAGLPVHVLSLAAGAASRCGPGPRSGWTGHAGPDPRLCQGRPVPRHRHYPAAFRS